MLTVCRGDSVDTQLYPDAMNMVYRALWPYVPDALLALTKYTPGRIYSRYRGLNAEFEKIGKPLYHSNNVDGLSSREGKKDVMSVLSESCNRICSGIYV